MMFVRIYRNSFLASLVSIIGSAVAATGIASALGGEPAGLIAVPVGIAFFCLAGSISEGKEFKKWQKLVRSKGIEDAMRTDAALAVSVYRTNPGERALSYITALNPGAGAYIRSMNAQAKGKAAA